MMTPEQEQAQMDAIARAIKLKAQAAFEQMMERIGAGESPRDAIAAATEQFRGDYYAELSAAFSAILDRSIGVTDIKSWPVGEVALSDHLYQHAQEVNAVTRRLIADHAKGFVQARELAMQIYEGYRFKDDPLKVKAKLPKYLREALRDPEVDGGFARLIAQIRVNELKTPALKAAYQQALDALEQGAGAARLKNMLRTAWYERNRYFANRIAQTELHRAYSNQVAQEIMADEATVWVKYQMSKTHPKVDICDRHAGLNGWGKGPGIYPKAQAPKPPAHPHCLSGDALITASGRITSVYKRWFNGDVVVITTATGKSVTATVNHPILTRHGWIGAGSINVGNDVVCRVASESVLRDVIVNDHHYDMPTCIAEIVDAFLSSGKVTTSEVPMSAEHFHGDGIAGQVAVVGTNRKLWDCDNAALGKGIVDHPFMVTHAGLAGLLGKRILDLKAKALRSTSDCIMGILGQCASLFLGKPGHSNLVGIGAAANGNALGLEVVGDDVPADTSGFTDRKAGFAGSIAGANVTPNLLADYSAGLAPNKIHLFGARPHFEAGMLESSTDSAWADSVLAREIIEGKTGAVVFEAVIKIERLAWNEHVYNLETESGHYTSNGIITHNCRCTVRPAYEVEGEPGKPVKDAEQRFMNRRSDYDQRLIAGSRDRLQQFRDGRSLESIYNEGKNPIYRWGRVGDTVSLNRQFRQPSGEFTAYDDGYPIVKPDTSTPLKKSVITFEDAYRNKTDLETGAFFNDDGSFALGPKTGKPDRVSFFVADLQRMAGKVYSHNHPMGASFSPQDVELAAEYGFAEIRAVTKIFRHSLSAVTWPTIDEIRKAVKEEGRRVEIELEDQIKTGQIRAIHYGFELTHRTWARVAMRLAMKYVREKS